MATASGQVFHGDLAHAEEVEALAALLRPQSVASFTDEVIAAGWYDIPSTYVVCTEDRAVPADAQRQMAERADDVVTMSTPHAPMLSAPDELRTVLLDVA